MTFLSTCSRHELYLFGWFFSSSVRCFPRMATITPVVLLMSLRVEGLVSWGLGEGGRGGGRKEGREGGREKEEGRRSKERRSHSATVRYCCPIFMTIPNAVPSCNTTTCITPTNGPSSN